MDPEVRAGMSKAGLARAKRHLFICLGPDCCESEDGEVLWAYVKKRIKETGIPAMRTKAQCFRICSGGPWMVVYPDGVWYGGVTPERFERILNEHLVAGRAIDEWTAAKNCFDGKGAINE